MATTQGRRTTVTDDDLKAAVKDRTPAGTQEIADYVGLTRQGAEYRLKQMHDQWQNPVWTKKIGPTRVWMHCHRVWQPGWPDDRTLYQEDVLRTDHTYLRRRYRHLVDQREVEQALYRVAPAATQEIADLIGLSRQAIGYRLTVLDYYEKIWSKKVGPTMVWMHPQVMDDPDPDRDTSARSIRSRIKGNIYRASRGHAPFGTNSPDHPYYVQHPPDFSP